MPVGEAFAGTHRAAVGYQKVNGRAAGAGAIKEWTMDWRIEPLILPMMVATLLLIAAMQIGHG